MGTLVGLQVRALGVHLVAPRVAAPVDPLLLLLLLLLVVEVRVRALADEGTGEAAADWRWWCCTTVWRGVAGHVSLDGRRWVGVWGSWQLGRVADGEVALRYLAWVSVHHAVNSSLNHCASVHHGMHRIVLLLAVGR